MRIKSSLMLAGVTTLALVSFQGLSQPAEQAITLEKIMSDPKWMGNSPQNPKWLPNSRQVIYQQNRQQGVIKDIIKLDVDNGQSQTVTMDALHLAKQSDLTFNAKRSVAAWAFKGDIYLQELATDKVTQLTATSQRESSPQFLNDGRLLFWVGDTSYTVATDSFRTREFLKLTMDDKPEAPEVKDDLIAKEQHKLIQYVAKQQAASVERFQYKNELAKKNKGLNRNEFYFGKGNYLVGGAVAPTGDKAIVVTAKSSSWRGKDDLMPNYIGQDGRIQFEEVRRRVADAEPNQQMFWYLNLETGKKHELKVSDLPDFDKDVLKSVKEENAKAKGETYESKKSPRTINLIVDWTWSQNPVQWHPSGNQVVVMMEAWDNKDRWLATVDFNKKKFVAQHQLHDDAWINYTFNDFGWFKTSPTLYFLSEQSGYSHIYTKALNKKKPTQVTKGQFEVSNLVLSQDDDHFFFRANVKHPGDYQIYKVASDARGISKPKALTNLEGNNTFELSPDETKLLVSHSNLLTPDELYLIDLQDGNRAVKLTHTVSDEFQSMPWVKPEIVAVPSSYQGKPVYARVYYPKDYKQGEKRRAVIFNHGAGYLQNSHKGWSGYFREFMFHSMLAQQGYVVMDMDYRASKGYGRDWRTAIYRQMGTPEIEDLKDGVDWLVEHANVDRKRVGTYGGSYGGFMTFMALFKEPELFQAGAALRPVSDWAHYNDGYTSNILNRPGDDMIAYRKSSPIYFAEGLNKPLLINAPMIDDNVFFLDVVRLVQRMIELEKQDFETAIFPVEPHGFKQPSSWLDEYRRIYKLFEQHL